MTVRGARATLRQTDTDPDNLVRSQATAEAVHPADATWKAFSQSV